jgi:hypothetical protein
MFGQAFAARLSIIRGCLRGSEDGVFPHARRIISSGFSFTSNVPVAWVVMAVLVGSLRQSYTVPGDSTSIAAEIRRRSCADSLEERT